MAAMVLTSIRVRHCLDLYTIRSELADRERALDGLRIAMVGDLRFGRTVHSLSKLLSLFPKV